MSLITWIGIFFCVTQSAMFSGMNLALFSISRLRLEVEASLGNRDATKILLLRKDSNFLLATVLWGNVGINVLLTLLSNSVLAGVSAFFFSTQTRQMQAEDGEGVTTYAAEACEKALAMSGIQVSEIDGIIMATIIPDQPVPSSASKLRSA